MGFSPRWTWMALDSRQWVSIHRRNDICFCPSKVNCSNWDARFMAARSSKARFNLSGHASIVCAGQKQEPSFIETQIIIKICSPKTFLHFICSAAQLVRAVFCEAKRSHFWCSGECVSCVCQPVCSIVCGGPMHAPTTIAFNLFDTQ